MRIAHLTDVHVQRPLRPAQLLSKRVAGAVNLHLLGRSSHFTRAAQTALVASVEAAAPDAILCSGDLTALATPQEFEAAHELIAPLFEARPTALVSGNHDTYTRSAWKGRQLEAHFARWMGAGPWPRVHLLGEELACIALDSAIAAWHSAGRCGDEQLEQLERAFADPALEGRALFVMLHYPLRGRNGEPYGPYTRNLRDARELEAALTPFAERILAIVHGHEHHGFRTLVELDGVHVPILDPGAGGYAHLPERGRTAHWCIYHVEEGVLRRIERFRFDGAQFVPEEGGAWASGG